jgi:hypothetical protein
MKKRLSILVAMSLTLSINATCFAAAGTTTTSDSSNSSTVNSIVGDQALSLDDALSYLEKNSIEIKNKDQKILLYQKQFDRDNMNAALINNSGTSEVNYPRGQYAAIKLQTDVIPKLDEQNIKDAKYDRTDSLQKLKFTVQQQYLSALACQDQINIINDQIDNVDKQIEQTKIKIENGVLTQDALQSLNVQKSQFQASLNTPKAQLQQNLLTIKQKINMDLDSNLTLLPTQKQYSKFDYGNIESKIDTAVKNNYNMEKINNNLGILKIKEAIYKQYSYNDDSGEVSTGLSIQDLENSLADTELNTKIGLWNSYYNIKNLEDNISLENVKVESAMANYNTILSKVKEGTAVQLQADSAQLSLKYEQVNLKNAQNNYMEAVDEFQYNLNN